MQLQVANFRGIKTAKIDLAHVTGLFGDNYAGKTSLINAIQVATTPTDFPLSFLTKKTAGKLIHCDEKKSFVKLVSDDGEVTITYPEVSRAASGQPIESDTHSAGIINLVDMKPVDRVQYLSEILKTTPTIEALRKKLEKIKLLSPDRMESLIKTAEVNGWDDAHTQASQMRTQLTGAWKQVTGDNWGAKKADGWRPANWDVALENATIDDLQARADEEREWLEAALSADAVEASEVARLKSLAKMKRRRQDDVDNLTVKLKTYTEGLKVAKLSVANAERAFNELETVNCPCCDAQLIIKGRSLEEYKPLTKEELNKRHAALKEAQDSLAELESDTKKATEDVIEARGRLKEAQDAETKLKEIRSKPQSKSGADKKTVEECRDRVTQAEAAVTSKKQVEKADLIYQKWLACQDVIDLLSPDGMRKTAAQEAVKKFNCALREIVDVSKYWAPIKIDCEFRFLIGGRHYELCSESEKYRCRVACQYAVAGITSAPLVLIDGADILDTAGRNGLFRIARNPDGPATVIAVTCKRDEVPDLSKVGGVSYIVSGQTVEVLGGE